MLKKHLGFWDSVAINVGVVIGVGIFRTPGAIAGHLDSSFLILLVWVLGALVALLGTLCYAELSSCFPHTGGTYVYLREAFGRPAGFLFGWAEFSVMRAGSVAGVAYILTAYLQNFLPMDRASEQGVTILVIAFFTIVNILGIHISKGVQNTLTILKIISILGLSVIIFSISKAPVHQSWLPSGVKSLWGIAPALIPVLWTYGGWHQSTFMSGEFKDTQKALPLSLVASVMIVALLYLLMNTAYLRVLTPSEMAGTKAIASDIFMNLFGPVGRVLVSAVVLVSASGALNSTILTGARIPFAVATDYPRFSWFAKVDERVGTPVRAFILNGVWASVLVLWGNFDRLLYFFAFANWLFFALTGISVFVLRKKMIQSKPKGNFSMIGYPWVPVLFIFSSAALCLITLLDAPSESFFGALILLAGLPIYLIFRGR